MGKVFADIDGRYIVIRFSYNPNWVNAMHSAHAFFVPEEKGGPYWRLPLEYQAATDLANAVGRDNLDIGQRLWDWGKREKELRRQSGEMGTAKDAELTRLHSVLPDLANTLWDFQRAGVAYGAFVDNFLIADQPGMGKTLESIATIFECGLEAGANLVVAPITSLETVWKDELEKWQPYPVVVAADAGMSRKNREEMLDEAGSLHEAGETFWLIINSEMIRYEHEKDAEGKIVKDGNGKAKVVKDGRFPWIHSVEWSNIIADEVHKGMLRHPATLTSQGMRGLSLKSEGKRIALSGTPMGGRPVNLFGILQFLHPERFTSKWAWAEQWLEITHNGYGKEIGGIRREREEAFQTHLNQYILRRTKAEVFKQLPPKQHVDVWCEMTKKQAKQYADFAAMAEIRIADQDITATNILAEYTRLMQFADAVQDVRELPDGSFKLTATPDSGKLNSLIEKLSELGIMDGEGEEQAVIFSQFTEVADMVYDYLVEKGVPTLKITGKVNKRGERAAAQRNFQKGEARVMVMNTKAGGVSITLDRASHVHILDETWDPDDQEQAEDRCHRASRIHQVTCYYYRSRNSIEEYKQREVAGKSIVNWTVLDLKRLGEKLLPGKKK